jgi:uncharacterized protein (TIRG00374 family)
VGSGGLRPRAVFRIALKLAITAGLFVLIFWEFGGRVVSVPGERICDPDNTDLFAVQEGGELRSVPVARVCDESEAHDIVLQGRTGPRRFGFFGAHGPATLVVADHCRDQGLAFVYEGGGKRREVSELPMAEACGTAAGVAGTSAGPQRADLGLRQRGFKIIPADPADILKEVRHIEPRRFFVWLLIAIFIKALGIFGNALRWQLLLRGQDIDLPYRYLIGSYFVGRWFGIVTPGTLGLDGYRLYDSIRASGKPLEATAVIFIDKVIGLVSLLSVVALVFPIGWRLLPIDTGAMIQVVGLMVAVALGFAVLLLVPRLSAPLLRIVPRWAPRLYGVWVVRKVHDFVEHTHRSATAYSDRRWHLIWAVLLACFGHFTTALMYWSILMGITDAPPIGLVLLSALMMTSATLVGPSIGGEGIREFVFVQLLKGQVAASQAFLFGHIGFWIEKLVLSIPGGVIYLVRPGRYHRRITEEDLDRVRSMAVVPDEDELSVDPPAEAAP